MTQPAESGLMRDAFALGASQLASSLIPLLALPLLVRTGVANWGHLAIGLSVGYVVRAVVEYGFEISAVARIAHKRSAGISISEDIAGVSTARLVLFGAALPTALAYLLFSGEARSAPAVAILGSVAGLIPGLQFTWALQSTGLLYAVPRTELLPRLLVVGSSLPLVAVTRSVLPYAGALILSSVITTLLQRRLLLAHSHDCKWAGFRAGIAAMQWGRYLFVYRLFMVAYTSANVVLLAALGSTVQVASFAAAERVARAAASLLAPATQALLPRMAVWARGNSGNTPWIASAGMIAIGASLSGATVLLSERMTFIVGAQLADVRNTMQVFSLLPLLISIVNVLGIQWLVPRGGQRYLNWAVACGALVNVGLAAPLVARYGAAGMAMAVISAEVAVCLVLLTAAVWLAPPGATSLPGSVRITQEKP